MSSLGFFKKISANCSYHFVLLNLREGVDLTFHSMYYKMIMINKADSTSERNALRKRGYLW